MKRKVKVPSEIREPPSDWDRSGPMPLSATDQVFAIKETKMIATRIGYIEQIDRPYLENFVRRLLKKPLNNRETLCIAKNPPFGQIGTFEVRKPHAFKSGDKVEVTIDLERRSKGGFFNMDDGIVKVEHSRLT